MKPAFDSLIRHFLAIVTNSIFVAPETSLSSGNAEIWLQPSLSHCLGRSCPIELESEEGERGGWVEREASLFSLHHLSAPPPWIFQAGISAWRKQRRGRRSSEHIKPIEREAKNKIINWKAVPKTFTYPGEAFLGYVPSHWSHSVSSLKIYLL